MILVRLVLLTIRLEGYVIGCQGSNLERTRLHRTRRFLVEPNHERLGLRVILRHLACRALRSLGHHAFHGNAVQVQRGATITAVPHQQQLARGTELHGLRQALRSTKGIAAGADLVVEQVGEHTTELLVLLLCHFLGRQRLQPKRGAVGRARLGLDGVTGQTIHAFL